MTTKVHAWLKQLWPYAAFCLAVFLFGGLFRPGDWYEALNRAPWSPPNIAFPIAWTLLYGMITFAGQYAAKSENSVLTRLWFTQLGFNAVWSWVFFGQHWTVIGLINLVILIVLVGAFIAHSLRSKNTICAWLVLPYLAWLCLATSLNAYIVVNN